MICIDSGAVGAILFGLIVCPLVPHLMDGIWAVLTSKAVAFLVVGPLPVLFIIGAYNDPEAFIITACLFVVVVGVMVAIGVLLRPLVRAGQRRRERLEERHRIAQPFGRPFQGDAR
jgi:hypothetical protein